MSGSGRPLLAARASPGESSNDGGGGSATPPANKKSGGRAKRTLIESACSACRRRKSRCNGLRPTCSRCQSLRTECQYEAEEGESRWSALRRCNQMLGAERDQVRELYAFVQTRPEAEALEIFHRIRQTAFDDVFQLLRQVKDGSLGNLPSPSPPIPPLGAMMGSGGGAEQQQPPRLPPIHAILEGPGRALHPTSSQHSLSLSSEESRGESSNAEPALLLLHPQTHALPDTLEPAPTYPRLPGPQLSLSSESSTAPMFFDPIGPRSPP